MDMPEYARYQKLAEDRLQTLCETYLPEDSQVCRAARYSLMGGGKRVRAVLVLAVCDMLGGDIEAASWLAGAVEMLHAYSLIHDDLPCMDDDDFRRGRPSCHKQFGEATALLAGDALLTTAFEVIGDAPLSEQARTAAVQALAHGAGARGMVLGQELDIAWEGKPATDEVLRRIHRNKTGALINAAVQMGAAASDGTAEQRQALETFAYGLGLVFQIVDDVLDVTSTAEQLGKPIGSDAENGKTTFATLYGPEGAQRLAQQVNEEACTALNGFGPRAEFLRRMAGALLERKK